MRGTLIVAGLLALSACANALAPEAPRRTAQPPSEQRAAAPATRTTPPPKTRTPMRPPLHLSDLIGRSPGEIDLRIGVPDLVRTEGNGQLRIYSNGSCILHLFAYPGDSAGRVTHVEARTQAGRLVGDDFNDCLAGFRRT